MKILRYATVGAAVALGVTSALTGAHAQNVISRTIDNEPVETTVTRGPSGTVVTRQPLAAPAASESVRVGPATYMDETVGAAPTRTVPRVIHPARPGARRVTHTRTVMRTARRVGAPLVLAPAERRVIYRTIVQEQVIPPAPLPGYPAYPAPAVSAPTVVAAPETTTGYAVTPPPAPYYNDDVYSERIATAYPVRYTVGSRLPADVVLTPLPTTAAVEVPAVRPYSYATIDNRVLLVDPATDTVVADITP